MDGPLVVSGLRSTIRIVPDAPRLGWLPPRRYCCMGTATCCAVP